MFSAAEDAEGPWFHRTCGINLLPQPQLAPCDGGFGVSSEGDKPGARFFPGMVEH